MVEMAERYPRLPSRQWWALRDRFKQSIPTRVTPSYLAAALNMQEKSAAANVMPALKAIGLIDEEGKPTQRAVRWRDDQLYSEVIEEIRSAIYPTDLRDAIPDPKRNREGVERWFASRTGHGLSAARKMAAFYQLISDPEVAPPEDLKRDAKEERPRPTTISRAGSRTASDAAFKLPGSSYGEIARVIRAYLAFSNPASLEEVARASGGMHPTGISRNTGFLVSLGILEGGAKKSLSEKGRVLARALDFEMPDEIRAAWRNIVAEHDFIIQLMSAVRIRGGMDAATLQTHIAYSAGQPRTQKVGVGAGAVIDVLRAADLLRETEGKLFATSSSLVKPGGTTVTSQEEPPPDSEDYDLYRIGVGKHVDVVIQVQIQCAPDDLDSLAPKLLTLIDQLRTASHTHSDQE
jgi:hypothetical protein